MSPVYASKRRADEFQALVERGEIADSHLGDLLVLVGSLRDVDPVMPRAEFSATLREQLMTAAATELVPSDAAAKLAMPARRSTRERRIAAAVGGLALVGASTGLAAAAQTALPGDALYPLKRAIENAHTGLSMGDQAKGATLLSSAQDRLEELNRLTARGDDQDAMAQTLADFTDQSTEASDLLLADYAQTGHEDSIAELRDFTASSLDALADLAPQVDGDARDALIQAARVITQIDAAAERACPSCGGTGIGDLPAILVAGGLSVPTPTTTLTLPGSTFTSTSSAEGVGQKGSNGGQGKGGKKGNGGDGPLALPGSGSAPSTGDDPLGQLGDAVTEGGSTTTSNGDGRDGIDLPDLSGPSAGTSSGGLGDAIGDTVSGIGDSLAP